VKRPTSRRRAGFGILENLLALTIVGVVVLGLSALLSGSGDRVRRDAMRLRLHHLAADVLAVLASRPRSELEALLPQVDQPRADILPAIVGAHPAVGLDLEPIVVGGKTVAVTCTATRSEPLPGRLQALTVAVDWSVDGRRMGSFSLFRIRRKS
jgi:type II secretory pathway pseudopilin PulG